MERLNDAHAELERAVGPELTFRDVEISETLLNLLNSDEGPDELAPDKACAVAFRELRVAMDAARAPAATAQQAAEVSAVVDMFLGWSAEQQAEFAARTGVKLPDRLSDITTMF